MTRLFKLPLSSRQRELLGFVVVGGLGFGVDAGTFALLFHGFELGPYTARIWAFVIAVVTTWILNRTFTFQVKDHSRLHAEFVTYLVAQGVGAGINFGVFAACLEFSALMRQVPLLALMVGSLIAMVVNFAAMKWVVFKEFK